MDSRTQRGSIFLRHQYKYNNALRNTLVHRPNRCVINTHNLSSLHHSRTFGEIISELEPKYIKALMSINSIPHNRGEWIKAEEIF